jgi:hypothetical protein
MTAASPERLACQDFREASSPTFASNSVRAGDAGPNPKVYVGH